MIIHRPRIAASATALAAVILTACSRPAPTGVPSGQTVVARTLVVSAQAVPVADVVPGTAESEDQVEVASRIMGYIQSMDVHEGESVHVGQLLFRIDPTDIEGAVRQAQAGLAQADAAMANAKANYVRFRNLYQDESIPRQQFESVRMQYEMAQAQVRAAHAGLATARANLRYAAVSAPMDGVVVQKLASVGDLASPGRPVVVVENPGRIDIRTQVSASTFARVRLGETVSVGLDGWPRPVAGTVWRTVPAADPVTHTYTVKIRLPAQVVPAAGTFARVAFPIGSRQAVAIPADAVLERAGITGVFVVDRSGVAHYRMVRTGEAVDNRIEIAAGLSPGERIAVSNLDALDNDDRIEQGGHHG
ncbi:MAG: efflux RND transporter periplasmic adaptor subunit [Betaproteobacteria bacterium]|nr:efflux RND transporter periplasmic adaptor subunit [Betaproteobacteria bacterium]